MGYSKYGDGKSIIEILNIGFEPLLTPKEYKVFKHIGLLKGKINAYKYSLKIINSNLQYMDDSTQAYKWFDNHLKRYTELLDRLIIIHKEKQNLFRQLLTDNKNITRLLYDNREFNHDDQFRNIAIFESDLTRCFGCKDMEHSDDIISVVTYYTEIFESIMLNGFDYKDKHFVFFTAGAGQTRNKKSTFVSEDKLDENFNRLFCGLTREMINNQGGMNTNKYLAYTSLCQTNSEIWTDFNIDRAIVVEDIEYEIPNQEVRYIYTETNEDKETLLELNKKLNAITFELKNIKDLKEANKGKGRRSKEEIDYEKSKKLEKKCVLAEIEELRNRYHSMSVGKRNITIPFTDGFGISLRKMESSMIRLPFMKGLMAYTPRQAFKDWCIDNNLEIGTIIDIYGKEHSIDDVDYIFTKSQFKMHMFYSNILDDDGKIIEYGWDIYKNNFKKYNCDACRCNVERNVKLNAKTNYQILQTLTTEMTDNEIKQLASSDIDDLNGVGNNIQSMLNILGANEDRNNRLTDLQKSLILYPEMFKDFYIKTLLKNTKNSMIKKFRSGKFSINGSYTYAIPDTLACLQWWFTGERDLNKLGFVEDGKVCCDLFEDGEKLDCLRSPHLDHAHCIRINMINEDCKKWIQSKGIYVGVKDTMSKLLMYDNDGDTLLVHNDKTIISCAERFQEKYKMIPNYYDMPKAEPELLNNKSLFEGIVLAYHHGNIGTPSNEITKIFATLDTKSKKEEIEEAIDVVALRVVDVNFTIDFAKTLYKPTIPKHILNKYKKYSGKKVPHFFKYAKNKTSKQVEKIGTCNIDRISNVVKNNRIIFKDLLGKYSYKTLMSDKNIDINTDIADKIVKLYNDINDVNLRELSYVDYGKLDIDEKKRLKLQMEFNSKKQKRMFVEYIGETPECITDVLVKSLQKDINKDLLWRLFGDIIYKNIEKSLEGTAICEKCGERFNQNAVNQKLCESCSTYQKQEYKTITCIEPNCKNTFDVDARNMTKTRCDECYKIHRRKKKAETMRKLREK